MEKLAEHQAAGSESGENMVFILGCERSGSTWLTNLFDAHPAVELFMEPFAPFARILPELPERNRVADETKLPLAALLREVYQKLPAMKYPYFYRPGKSLLWKRVDRFIWKFRGYARKGVRLARTTGMRRYSLLSLNADNTPLALQSKKRREPHRIVTKELRLNFKVGLLHRAFPDAVCLLAIRHPGAQISSILRLFERGNLGELKQSLEGFREAVLKTEQALPYKELFARVWREDQPAEQLIVWWMINYDLLLRECKRLGVRYRVIYHEDLSEHPAEEFDAVLAFAGLSGAKEVDNYLIASSTRQTQSESPVDTMRQSSDFYKAAINQVDAGLKEQISKAFTLFDASEELRRYA